jgi:hypothetical protein
LREPADVGSWRGMIERHHYLKLKPEWSNDASRAEIVERALAVLPNCRGVLRATAGVPADPDSAAAWDICITVRFAHLDDVGPYRADPAHRSFVDGFLAPRVEVKKGWNFAVRVG